MSMGQIWAKVQKPFTCRCLGEMSCASGSSSPEFLCTQCSCSFLGAGWDLWDMAFYRHTHNDLHQTSCVDRREPAAHRERDLNRKSAGQKIHLTPSRLWVETVMYFPTADHNTNMKDTAATMNFDSTDICRKTWSAERGGSERLLTHLADRYFF